MSSIINEMILSSSEAIASIGIITCFLLSHMYIVRYGLSLIGI